MSVSITRYTVSIISHIKASGECHFIELNPGAEPSSHGTEVTHARRVSQEDSPGSNVFKLSYKQAINTFFVNFYFSRLPDSGLPQYASKLARK